MAAVRQIERSQQEYRERLGVGFVYASDELYILSGADDVPPARYYDGFPVLSNGVGLIRTMRDEWRQLLGARARDAAPRRIAWLTGRLAAPALERMAEDWYAVTGWRPEVVTVDNRLFGTEVTVSGLLSGADLIDALGALPSEVEDVVLPRGPFGFDGHCTLDGILVETVGDAHPGRVHLAASPRELLTILASG
jgi:NifB/MoaA-like Fe-S oxidoreductase